MTSAPHGDPDDGDEPDPFPLDRLPPRLRRTAEALTRRWPGRVALASARSFARLEIFDRSMTIAAQFFTSVFPLLIILSVSFGNADSDRFGAWLKLPEDTQKVVDQAVNTTNSTGPYVVISLFIVLASGTSLSRALSRAFAKVWDLSKPKNRVGSAWRWLAVLAIFACFLVLGPSIPTVADDIPPSPTLSLLILQSLSFLAISGIVPWILLERRVSIRMLVPGALLFMIVLDVCRPLIQFYLPRALAGSAEHYGTIGVAFAYISFLYMVSFGYLGCVTLGSVIARDDGWLGRLIRGEKLRRPKPDRPGQDLSGAPDAVEH